MFYCKSEITASDGFETENYLTMCETEATIDGHKPLLVPLDVPITLYWNQDIDSNPWAIYWGPFQDKNELIEFLS